MYLGTKQKTTATVWKTSAIALCENLTQNISQEYNYDAFNLYTASTFKL
ncbi:hypothetical protein GXM_09434 [Nostoc sphaeroides CCNUC1]|uniref:Uncharacterized protein n=1 Tax=Nostoc sphaeroides CCNUC1 TaxID=2653204 RepID=A0A5P8WH50_9NOSO|nr:hypothetical protein GXM_09434 [Nostoc sphaeroides CCNUC1]